MIVEQKNDQFVVTTAIKKLSKLEGKIKVIPGGTSAGKTFGIIPLLINLAIVVEGLEVSIVSESVPHLKRGAMKDFKKIMMLTGRGEKWDERFNKASLTYTFANGSYIEFFSADQDSKVRGARRDVLYVNECNNIKFATYDQLAVRTRREIWLDFNPSSEFWAHEELMDHPKAKWLTLTYLDNETLDQDFLDEMDRRREKAKTSAWWNNWWQVYGLGRVGVLEGVIFTDWKQVASIPTGSRLLGYSIDFGYTNDPTAMYKVYRATEGLIIFDEICYRVGMKNSDIADVLRSAGARSGDIIIADSSEPKSIAEINSRGFRVRGVKKGPDSILFGISALQEISFAVTKRSTNLIKELRRYAWDTDEAGNSINTPIDAFNHGIDAIRYFAMMVLTKKITTRRGLKRRN